MIRYVTSLEAGKMSPILADSSDWDISGENATANNRFEFNDAAQLATELGLLCLQTMHPVVGLWLKFAVGKYQQYKGEGSLGETAMQEIKKAVVTFLAKPREEQQAEVAGIDLQGPLSAVNWEDLKWDELSRVDTSFNWSMENNAGNLPVPQVAASSQSTIQGLSKAKFEEHRSRFNK